MALLPEKVNKSKEFGRKPSIITKRQSSQPSVEHSLINQDLDMYSSDQDQQKYPESNFQSIMSGYGGNSSVLQALVSPRSSQQLSVFKGLNPNNVQSRQKLLVRKLNTLVDRRKEKQALLESLQKQLEQMREQRLRDQQIRSEVDTRLRAQDLSWNTPEKMFQQAACDQIMDIKALQACFNFSDIGSIYEMKGTLKRKLALVDTRLKEAELKNSTYQLMLNQMQRKHQEQSKRQQQMAEQREDINQTVEEIKHVNLLENQRVIKIENMQFAYHNALETHRHKMQLLLQEKKVTLHNCEEETKKFLMRILENVRATKVCRKTIETMEKARELAQQNEAEVTHAFRRRQIEIKVVSDFLLLIQLKKYSNDLNKVHRETRDDEKRRLTGIQLINELKANVHKVKTPPVLDSASSLAGAQQAELSTSRRTLSNDASKDHPELANKFSISSRDDHSILSTTV